jgi:hypothetical protein
VEGGAAVVVVARRLQVDLLPVDLLPPRRARLRPEHRLVDLLPAARAEHEAARADVVAAARW